MDGLNKLLESLANIINTSVTELQSILHITKDNLPEIYQKLAFEHALWSVFDGFKFLTICLTVAAALLILDFFVTLDVNKKKPSAGHVEIICCVSCVLFFLWILVIISPIFTPNITLIKSLTQ